MSTDVRGESGAATRADVPGSARRIPALDGLRAFAVAAVMLFHTASVPLQGGFLGVDVFFVLSGFLITGLLRREGLARGHIALAGFWLRRARRLAPPLLLVLLAVAIARLAVPQVDAAVWRGEILSALTYTTNWFQILTGGDYFAEFGRQSPLVHTWSLAIEEQFYLGFAVLFALVGIRWPTRRFVLLVGVLIVVSAASMAYASGAGAQSWAYYGTVPRVQALLFGALLALVLPHVGDRPGVVGRVPPGVVGSMGLVGLTVAFIRPPSTEAMFRGGFLLAAVMAGMVIYGILGSPALSRLLSWRPLVGLGLISYGVYLWHWPVFLWLQGSRGDARLSLQMWSMVVTIMFALASYVLLERPIRFGRFSRLRPSRQWLVYACAAGLIAAFVMLPARHLPDSDDLDWPATQSVPRQIFAGGDSTMLSLAVAFPTDQYPETHLAGETPMGCGLVGAPFVQNGATIDQERCSGWQDRWRLAVASQTPDVAVIGSGVWDLFDRAGPSGAIPPGEPGFDEPFVAAFREAASLASDGGRLPVFVLGVPCMASLNDQAVLNDRSRVDTVNALIRAGISDMPDVHYVDLTGLTCLADGSALVKKDGRVIRDDGVHWTPSGARLVWAHILQKITEVDQG